MFFFADSLSGLSGQSDQLSTCDKPTEDVMVGQQLDKEKKEVLEKIKQKKEDRIELSRVVLRGKLLRFNSIMLELLEGSCFVSGRVFELRDDA